MYLVWYRVWKWIWTSVLFTRSDVRLSLCMISWLRLVVDRDLSPVNIWAYLLTPGRQGKWTDNLYWTNLLWGSNRGKGSLCLGRGDWNWLTRFFLLSQTYLFTIFPPPKWLLKKIDRIRRSFLWCGEDEAHGSKCLINWTKVCSPKVYDGLGIKDLERFSRALRLRWLWFEWDADARPWKGLPVPFDEVDRNLFAACTRLEVGNGGKVSF